MAVADQNPDFVLRKLEIKTGVNEEEVNKPRDCFKIAYLKGKIYAICDQQNERRMPNPNLNTLDFFTWLEKNFKEMWELNLFTKTWTKCSMKGEVPTPLVFNTAFQHPFKPGVMLIYGGTRGPETLSLSSTKLISCDLETQSFTELVVDKSDYEEGWMKERPVAGRCLSVSEGRVFMVRDLRVSDVDMIDMKLNPPKFHNLYKGDGSRDEPETRSGHGLALWDDKIFVLGGSWVGLDEFFGFQVLPTFTISDRGWSSTPTMADPSIPAHVSFR